MRPNNVGQIRQEVEALRQDAAKTQKLALVGMSIAILSLALVLGVLFIPLG